MIRSKPAQKRKRTSAAHPAQRTLFSSQIGVVPESLSDGCRIVSVGKRRDGGTRYWCLLHKADATAKYGKPAKSCRASHIAPIRSEDILFLDIDRYKGGVALWGAVPAVYDTTRLPMERGIHVHARVSVDSSKEMDYTYPGSAHPKQESARKRDCRVGDRRYLLYGYVRIRLRHEVCRLSVLR